MNNITKKTVVYVLGLSSEFKDYMQNIEVSEVKIGQTSVDVDVDSYEAAFNRVKKGKTSYSQDHMVFECFEFPMNGNVDDKIRKKLTLQLYPNLKSSMKVNENAKLGVISAGREFVYEVTRSQIRHAITEYSLEVILDAIAKQPKSGSSDLTDVANLIGSSQPVSFMMDDSDESEKREFQQFWQDVNKLCPIEFPNSSRPYMTVNSLHENCLYNAYISKRYGMLSVDFRCFAKSVKDGKKYTTGIRSKEAYRDAVSMAMSNAQTPKPESLQGPIQGKKRSDMWFWRLQIPKFPDREENVKWLANAMEKMHCFFEQLDIEANK